MYKHSKYIISIVCLAIVIFRMIFPYLTFDLISVSLLAIGTLAILIKNPEKLFQKAKKIKLGSFELELQELNKETEKVEENLSVETEGSAGLGTPEINENEELYQITDDYSSNLIRLSVEIEKTLRIIFERHFKSTEKRPLSVGKMIERLGTENVIDYDTAKLLRKFWNLRNKLIHDHKFEIQKMDFVAFNDIGIRILKILKVIKKDFLDGGEGLPHYGLQ